MAGAWGSSFTSRWPATFGDYHAPPKPKKQDDEGGLAGFFENLINDIGDAVVGIPMGIKTMFSQSPTETFKQMGLQVWQDWSPLFKGEVDEWWDNFTAHPLAPILDVAGVLTLGAGSVVKGVSGVSRLTGATAKGGVVMRENALTQVLGKMGGRQSVPLESPTQPGVWSMEQVVGKGSSRVIKAPGMQDVYKHYSANPFTRARQHFFESAGQAIGGSKANKGGYLDAEVKGTGPGGIGEVQTAGRIRGRFGDAAAVNKLSRKEHASRQHALKAATFSAMEAARRMYDKATTDAERRDIAQRLYDNAHNQFLSHPMVRAAKGTQRDGLAPGLTYIADPKYHKASIDMPKTWDGKGVGNYFTRMAKDGEWMTDDVNRAWRGPDGRPLVVRADGTEKWLNEGKNSSEFLDLVWNKPTMVWKAAVLAYSPRFFINNVIGNSLMYFMATNPAAAIRAVKDASRENRRLRASDLDDIDKLSAGTFQERLGYESKGLGSMEMAEDWAQSKDGRFLTGRQKTKLKGGIYGVTHKYSEDLIRQATMYHAARQTPAYWANRSAGYTHEQSIQRALQNPAALAKVRNKLDNTLGNYSYLNRGEQAIKKVIPFYTWDRAILRHTANMVSERPYLASALVHIGEMGHEEFIKQFGKEVPHFLFNGIGIGVDLFDMIPGLDTIPGRKTVLSTQGMNPYGTVGELAHSAGSVVGLSDRRMGETIGSQINPLAAAAVESLSGVDMISGAPIERSGLGLLGEVYGNTFEGIPQARLLKTILEGRPKAKQTSEAGTEQLLFRGDVSQQLLSLLGIPVKRYSPEQAKEIYWRQQGGNPRGSYDRPGSFFSGTKDSAWGTKAPGF